MWVKSGLKVGGFDKALNGVIWGEGLENRRFCKEKGAVTSSLERLFFLQYLPDSFTHEDAQNLLEKLGCDNTNPYKLLWTGEKRNFIEQDPNTGVYHKTAHYYEVYPKHAA